MYKVTYWVLVEETEETVAITPIAEYAEWICNNFPKKCILRITFDK